MIVEKSHIKFLHFGVSEFDFKCHLPRKNKKATNNLVVDLNYDISYEEERKLFQITMDVKLSPQEDAAGYNISLKSFGIFGLPESEVKEETDKILLNTCVPLLLGSTRGFLSDVTSNFPFGKYLLPSISMRSIIRANSEKPNV